MTRQSTHATAHLMISISCALVTVAVFSLLALPFGVAGLTAPEPAPILLGAAILTIVMPPTRRSIARLVDRYPRWSSAGSYELMALGARLEPQSGSGAVLSDVAELARRSVGGSSAKIQSELGETESGVPDRTGFGTAVMHQGREIARLTVTSSSPLKPPQQTRLEQLATSVGVVVANAIAVGSIERKISDLGRTIELITLSRRSVVSAETAERDRVAREVIAGAAPIFQRLRATVAATDFDEAAAICDQLIVFLRGFSTAMRET